MKGSGGDSGVSAGQWEQDAWPWEEEPQGAGTGDEGPRPRVLALVIRLPASLAGPAQGPRRPRWRGLASAGSQPGAGATRVNKSSPWSVSSTLQRGDAP